MPRLDVALPDGKCYQGLEVPDECSVAQWKASLEAGNFGTKVLYAHKLVCSSGNETDTLQDAALLPAHPAIVQVTGPKTILAMLELLLRKQLGAPVSHKVRRPQKPAATGKALKETALLKELPMPDNAPSGNIEAEIKLILSQLTAGEKFGQMLQLERKEWQPENLARFVRSVGLGSLLSGGGSAPEPNSPESWAEMVNLFQRSALQARVQVPLLYGNDSVHGHSNLKGAVLFPHNIGLGCSGDPALVRRCAEITAIESRASGVHWVFAPALSMAEDVRWGRTYEGFSDDFSTVASMGRAAVGGYQANKTIACVKHWVGDGSTTFGTGKGDLQALDCGDCQATEAELRKKHIPPYVACLEAGCQTVMASFSSVQGEKMHGHHRLLTEVLKEELGFDGILVSDWAAVDELAPKEKYLEALVKAINAGIDMVMLPGIVSWGNQSPQHFFSCMRAAMERGLIPIDRIDDAVARILRVKLRMGLFQDPYAHRHSLHLVGCDAHRDVAREAVRRSMVMLKNKAGALPLGRNDSVLVTGEGANNLGMQCGGWSIEHQGFSGNSATKGTTILQGLKELGMKVIWDPAGRQVEGDVALVVCGERPYAETAGDVRTFAELFSPRDVEKIRILKRSQPERRVVLLLLCGRPLPLSQKLLAILDAVLVAWLPGTEGLGVAEVLCQGPAGGKLSVNWPEETGAGCLFPRGFGLAE